MLGWLLKKLENPEDKLSDKAKDHFKHNYLKIVDGKIECSMCGSYCGQCGGRYLGLTIDEYEKELRS